MFPDHRTATRQRQQCGSGATLMCTNGVFEHCQCYMYTHSAIEVKIPIVKLLTTVHRVDSARLYLSLTT